MTNFTSTFKQPKFQSNTTQCVFSSEQRIKNGKTKNLFSCQLLLQLFLKTVSTHFLRNTAAFIFCDLIFFKNLLGTYSYLWYFSTFVTIIKSSNESLSFSRPMNQLQKPPTSICIDT